VPERGERPSGAPHEKAHGRRRGPFTQQTTAKSGKRGLGQTLQDRRKALQIGWPQQ
jgi:hypothetical protein